MLKKVLLFCMFAAPLSAFAASVHFGDYFLKASETASDDIYVVGRTSNFSGTAEGDVVSVGRTIFSQSKVGGDVLFVGEEVKLEGEVLDDARIAGALVTIDGIVKGDVLAFGSRIGIGPSAVIEGSFYAVGSIIEVKGTVKGGVKSVSETFVLSGSVDKDLELWGDASFREPARIGGDFIYHTDEKAGTPVNVTITGKTVIAGKSGGGAFPAPIRALTGGFFSLRVLMMLALGFALFFLARGQTEDVLQEASQSFGIRILRGTLVIVLMFILTLVLIPSVIGIPLALVTGSLLLILLLLSWVCAGILLGIWAEKFIFRRSPFPLSYRSVLLGVIFISIISLVPLVGPLFHGILLLAVAGSFGTLFFRHVHKRL